MPLLVFKEADTCLHKFTFFLLWKMRGRVRLTGSDNQEAALLAQTDIF